jgi:hypothetical protein
VLPQALPQPKKIKRRPRRRRNLRRKNSQRRRNPSLLLPPKMRTSIWIFSDDLNLDYT